MEKKYEGKTIYIQRWNNGERVFKREHTVFDECEISSVFSGLCETPTESYEIRKMIADGIKGIHGQELFDKETDITSITLNINDIDNEVDKLANEILDMTDSVGGDDDTFDYFPDIVCAFCQICETLDMMNKYNELISKLNTILGYTVKDEEYFGEQ